MAEHFHKMAVDEPESSSFDSNWYLRCSADFVKSLLQKMMERNKKTSRSVIIIGETTKLLHGEAC